MYKHPNMNCIRKFILTSSKTNERSNYAFNAITDQFISIGKRQPHFNQKQKNDNPMYKNPSQQSGNSCH